MKIHFLMSTEHFVDCVTCVTSPCSTCSRVFIKETDFFDNGSFKLSSMYTKLKYQDYFLPVREKKTQKKSSQL